MSPSKGVPQWIHAWPRNVFPDCVREKERGGIYTTMHCRGGMDVVEEVTFKLGSGASLPNKECHVHRFWRGTFNVWAHYALATSRWRTS